MCDVLGEDKEVKKEELLEKTAEISNVQKQLEDLHKGIESPQGQEENPASFYEEKKTWEKACSMLNKSLEAEKMARLETATALEEAKQREEKGLAALSKERSEKKELQSALEVQQEQVSRLVKEGGQREQEAIELRGQVNELTAKLEASQQQVGQPNWSPYFSNF